LSQKNEAELLQFVTKNVKLDQRFVTKELSWIATVYHRSIKPNCCDLSLNNQAELYDLSPENEAEMQRFFFLFLEVQFRNLELRM
jgi:hypothetical protein